MAQSHCRVCFQFLPAFNSRCPQCGDVNPRRVWSTVFGGALEILATAAGFVGLCLIVRLATPLV